jgi:Fe-S-cluster containining protein
VSEKPWYADGLRFECTGCGNCCKSRGEYSTVYLMQADVDAMAAQLGMTDKVFLETHCEGEEGWTVLRSSTDRCRFLASDNTCEVYDARPMQCRTWPFWEENLSDRATWEGPLAEDCPGIGQGQRHSAEEIQATSRRNENWYEPEG